MSGVNKDAPAGILAIQTLSSWCCPRLHFNRQLCYRASVLLLTYFTYMTYHLTRKPISVVKNVLHQNCSALPPPDFVPADNQWCNWAPFNDDKEANTLLGMLDSAFLFSYAAAMFLSGFVAERVDLRYFLSIGMLMSGIFCYLFGLARTYSIHNIYYYIFVQAGAGVAQTTGWPGTVAVVGNWFGDTKKGLIFGVWNSHTSLGNIFGTLLASRYVESDWALSFVYPGLVMGCVGFVVFLFLAPEPAAVGLRLQPAARSRQSTPTRQERRSVDEDSPTTVIVGDQSSRKHVDARNERTPINRKLNSKNAANLRPSRHSANISPQEECEPTERTPLVGSSESSVGAGAVSMAQALAIPGVVEFSLSLFFAKLVNYTFLYWLPLYIRNTTSLSSEDSAKLSTLFDVGGIAGAVLAGAVADYSGCPALVCVVFYLLSAPMLLVYQQFGSLNYSYNVVLLLVNGLLVNAPYALITTAVSAELGTHSCLAGNSKALATVTAIIDGTGSIGAAVGPLLAGVVSAHGTWSQVFYMLISCIFCALFLLLRVVRTELVKLRTRRSTLSRVVRVE